MKKTALLFLLILCLGDSHAQQTIKIGGWRIHLPYNSVEQLVETPNLIYVKAEIGMYSFNKLSGEIELYSKVNGFSETEISALAYSQTYNALVIGYENTNIDILKDGKIINLPGVLRKTIVGKKQIYEVRVHGKYAYVCTSFGMVVLDLELEDIADSYLNIGPGGTNLEIFSVAEYNSNIYIGTDKGIFTAPLSGSNLSDFNSWEFLGGDSLEASLLRSFNGSMYYVQDSQLNRYDGTMKFEVEGGMRLGYRSIETDHNKLTVCKDSGIFVLDVSGARRDVTERFKHAAVLDHQENIWTGGFYTGLIRIEPNGQQTSLTPQGPFSPASFNMLNVGEQIWVSSGGHSSSYSPFFNSGGFYYFEDGRWTNRDLSVPELAAMFDFTCIAANESSGDVWLGSFGTGIVHLKNGAFVERLDNSNSVLQPYVNNWTMCLGMAFNNKGELWITNFEGGKPLVLRKTDGQFETFSLPTERVGKVVIDDFGTLWILVERGVAPGDKRGLLAFHRDENGQIQQRWLVEGEGTGNLPNNVVNVATLDRDGEIWLGTDAGLAVFYNPSLVFQGGINADAQQIIIDDGQDIGYLLGNEVVNDIKIDGANRKWVATNNGAWLIAPDGSKVIYHFTTSNSPLPSNEVHCLAINPVSGEVFFGTERGIISYRGDATSATDVHSNPLIYPNPVEKGYEGPITITGLPEDATVKIADVAGRVVYELIATGGTAVWHGRNFAGELPQSGVYLIFTANKEDEDVLVSKLLIVR